VASGCVQYEKGRPLPPFVVCQRKVRQRKRDYFAMLSVFEALSIFTLMT
jgi:hypothetical protein